MSTSPRASPGTAFTRSRSGSFHHVAAAATAAARAPPSPTSPARCRAARPSHARRSVARRSARRCDTLSPAPRGSRGAVGPAGGPRPASAGGGRRAQPRRGPWGGAGGARAGPRRRGAPRPIELTAPVGGDRADRRVDNDLPLRRELRCLDEQAERKARGDLEAREPPAPPRPRRLLPRDEPLGTRFQLGQIRAMTGAHALDGDRVGGPPTLAVGYPGPEERELTGEELVGQDGLDADPTDGLLGEHARHDDQAEQHRDEEVEEIVPGVDRGESEAERGADAPPAVARGPERAPRPPPPEPTLGCHAGVTGEGRRAGGSETRSRRVECGGHGAATEPSHDGPCAREPRGRAAPARRPIPGGSRRVIAAPGSRSRWCE